ncbi:MAG: hypothetical protein ACI4EF_00735 [Coprococcus sp.]
MRRNNKNKDFKIAPVGHASDTIISYFMGGLSIVFVALSIIKSVVSKGHVERVYGVLLVCALIMSVTGIIFGITGYRAETGSMFGKKLAVLMSSVAFVLSGIFMLKGL